MCCSFSPVLNLPGHLLCSVFGRSEFHGKFVCQTHSPIAVFFGKVGCLSDLRYDHLPRVVQLSNFILCLLFGRKFEHLFRRLCVTLIHD